MKILTENDENVIKCNTCDCLYEYENSDLKPIFSRYLIECPKCGQQVILVVDTLKPTNDVVEVEPC